VFVCFLFLQSSCKEICHNFFFSFEDLMSGDASSYHGRLLKEGDVHMQACNGNFDKKLMCVVSLPGKWEGGQKKEKEKIRQAFKHVFEKCNIHDKSVAVVGRKIENPEFPLRRRLIQVLDVFLEATPRDHDCHHTMVIHTDSADYDVVTKTVGNAFQHDHWVMKTGRGLFH
jgi:hypothetical protein